MEPDLPIHFPDSARNRLNGKFFAAFIGYKAFFSHFQPNSLAMRPSALSRLDIAVAKESLI